MGEEESTKVEVEGVAGTAAHPPPAGTVKDLAKDKSAVPLPAEEEKPDDSKAIATEALEKKKAEYVEKMKNKIAMLHKAAEEKKAMVEAKRGEEFLKAEEMAAKYRVTGFTPKKLLGCFGA
ncbi:hypothetical protein GW17_00051009 [Ensete ventricosum]|nr:hypothetical protein GW17_00051009 [Ensete ventricosum]RZR98716.1 hypothetical protein BHM03_00028137 [Ensete ventricosum]